jgi:hypothetical protein
MTTLTASKVIDGITFSVSVRFADESSPQTLQGLQSSCEAEESAYLSERLAVGTVKGLAAVEREIIQCQIEALQFARVRAEGD